MQYKQAMQCTLAPSFLLVKDQGLAPFLSIRKRPTFSLGETECGEAEEDDGTGCGYSHLENTP